MLLLVRFRNLQPSSVTLTYYHHTPIQVIAHFLGFTSLNIETQWLRYLPEEKIGSKSSILLKKMRSVRSTTYPECRYIDVTSIFCISGVEIHFWQHFNVRLWRQWYFEKCGFWEILGSISETFLMGLEVSFFWRFSILGVLNVFADGSWSLGFVILHFRLVFRSRIFQSSWVQLMELNL